MERKKVRILIAVGAAFLGLCLAVGLFVGIRIAPYECITVVFDKYQMKNADRVLIRQGNQCFEVTDRDLVDEITDATLYAERWGQCCDEKTDRWIEVYCGDNLVRRMRWEANHDSVLVYEPDAGHWILGTQESGQVYPSAELLEKLDTVIQGE